MSTDRRRWGRLVEPPAFRPLSGRTPAEVVSQLIYRLFGPDRAAVLPLLDLHGLAGRPATNQIATGVRNHVPQLQLRLAQRNLAAEAARCAIDAAILREAARPTGPFEDHQSRVCIAQTLGVAKPVAWRPSYNDSRAVRTCLDVLAIAGPLTLVSMARAVQRTRHDRPTPIPTDAELALLLIECGQAERGVDDLWRITVPRPERVTYRAIADAIGERVLRRIECTRILLDLGYAPSSAERQGLDRQPMIDRIEPGRYALIGFHERARFLASEISRRG